jgi:hypothetical protein
VKKSFTLRALQHNPVKSALADLQRKKLELEVKEQKRWYLKTLAPYVTTIVAVAGLALTYIHERNASRAQHEQELSRISTERAADKAQAERFIEQITENRREADTSREQIERHHREELFAQSLGQLGSLVPMQRVAAIDALSEFSRDREFRERATASLATLLEQETDPSTEEALYKAFDIAIPSDLDALVRANVQAQISLARSYGRYVGIEMGRKFPGSLGSPVIPTKDVKDYERSVIIGDPVATVYYHRRPLEEIVSHEFIRDAFWLQSFPDTQREIFNTEKNGAWASPPKDFDSAKQAALTDIRHATRYLEITSSILENVLRTNSGKVQGWNLSGTYFVVADFRHLDLRGIVLSKAHLEMADLRGANLSNAVCIGTNFDGANFSGAKLVWTNLTDANLDLVQPFPLDTARGYVHTYVSPDTKEDLRFRNADFAHSSWNKAGSISPTLRSYLTKSY